MIYATSLPSVMINSSALTPTEKIVVILHGMGGTYLVIILGVLACFFVLRSITGNRQIPKGTFLFTPPQLDSSKANTL